MDMSLPGPACTACSRILSSFEAYFVTDTNAILCLDCGVSDGRRTEKYTLVKRKKRSPTRERGSDHYKHGAIEPIDYILAHKMGFIEGNVVKYITRYRHSGKGMDDLHKAKHYLEMLIEHVEKEGIDEEKEARD